jgi:hypothetical protein
MQFKKQILYGLATGLMVVVYCSLVATFMFSMESIKLFQEDNTVIAITAILLLMVLSAAVTGALVFAYPAYLFIKKEFKAAIYALASNLATILIAGGIVIFLIFLIFKII